MADYPGQQYGGNPGNYQSRTNTGYQPMQPQQPQLFRSQQQNFNRASPGYPQPSSLGQPTPPMGMYQQQMDYQDSPLGYNQQVTNRHLMNQSIDSPHMGFMNQDSPIFYGQQSSNSYMLNQDSPTMMNQRFSSPQMGMSNMSQTNPFGSSYMSSQPAPTRTFYPNQYFPEQTYQSRSDNRQSVRNAEPATTESSKPEKPRNYVHPASMAFSKLLSNDLYTPNKEQQRAEENKIFPCTKAVRYDALLKIRRQQIADAESLEVESDSKTGAQEPPSKLPSIRGRIKIKKHLAVIKCPKPTKTEKKEKSEGETAEKPEQTLPVHHPPMVPENGGLESVMLEELTEEFPQNDDKFEEVEPTNEQQEQEKQSEKDKKNRQPFVKRLAVISKNFFIQPELVEPDVASPTVDESDRLIHTGNILPSTAEVDGTWAMLKNSAMERSFDLRKVMDADDIRVTKPEEWYQLLEALEPRVEEEVKIVEEPISEEVVVPVVEEKIEQAMDVDEYFPQSEYTAAQEAEWEEVMRQEIQPPTNELSYGRDFLVVPQREEPNPGAVAMTKKTMEKIRLEKIARNIELIPWRSLQPNVEEGKPVPHVLPWHPPMVVPIGRIIVNKIGKLSKKNSIWKPPIGWSKWHPPLAFDEKLMIETLESLPEIDEKTEDDSERKEFSDPQPLTEEELNKMKSEPAIKFSKPLVTLQVEVPVDKPMTKLHKKPKKSKKSRKSSKIKKAVNGTKVPASTEVPKQKKVNKKPHQKQTKPKEIGTTLPSTVFNPSSQPNKSILKSVEPMIVDEKETKKHKAPFMLYRNLNDIEPESGRISPSLITIPYKRAPESNAPAVPIIDEANEPEFAVDRTKNPLFADRKRRTRLNDEKAAWILTEFRVSSVRQNQAPNIWESNNQKMIDLMKTKGASIDSSVREEAKKTLKFLEEKAADLIGKHATIRNKLLQFCLDFSFDFDDFTEEDNIFYMKLGDYIIQLELDKWQIKDGWSFWNVAKPIRSPNLVALMNGERWEDAYKAIARMVSVIPSSLTNEDKDVICQSLEVIERDLQRYHANVKWRSHVFALNDMLPRTDITPFAVVLPRPPCEPQKDFMDTLQVSDRFESSRDLAFFKVQIDAMNPHPFPLKSCLTPAPFLTWVNAGYHKLGARFLCKLNRPIPFRYGAFEQLKAVVDEIVVEDQFINAYHILLELAYPHMNQRVSDITDNFIMYFDEDTPDDSASHDYLISGFYFNHPGQIVSALYIIKKEVIMNRLCESTIEQDPHTLAYKYSNATIKHRINVRLGEIMDGKFKFYFKYNCFLIEVHLKVTDYGDVELEHLRAAHHGYKSGLTYLTVTNYEDLIEKSFKNEPVYFKSYQFKKLNEIIGNTWNIPKLIDGIIGFLRTKCQKRTLNKPHMFKPSLTTLPRTIRNKKLERDQRIQELKEKLKDMLDEQKKKRKLKRKGNDHGKKLKKDNGDNDPTGGNSNGKGNSTNGKNSKTITKENTEKSSTKGLGYMSGNSSSSDFDAADLKRYKRKLVKFIRKNLDDILLGFKQSSFSNRRLDLKLVLKYLDEIKLDDEGTIAPPKAKQIEDKGGGSTRQSFDSNEDDVSSYEVDSIGRKEYLRGCLHNKSEKRWFSRWKLNKKNTKLSFRDLREIRRQEAMNKSKTYIHNIIRDKMLWRRQMQGIPRQHRRGRRFNWQKVNSINPRLGYSWKKFIRYFNTGYDQYNKRQQHAIIWPLLKDQRVTVNFGKIATENDEENLELGEMDEFFNLSDSEDRGTIGGSSTFAPKILKPLKKKPLDRLPTVLGVIRRLVPGGKKFLLRKFKKLKKDKQHKDEQWVKDWDPSSIEERFKKLEEKQPTKEDELKKKKNQKIFDYDARPTAMRFYAMITRIRKKKNGFFPNEALRHAANVIVNGPYKIKPFDLNPVPPLNSRSTTPVKIEQNKEENKENVAILPKLSSQRKINKILASSTFVYKKPKTDEKKQEKEKEKSENKEEKKPENKEEEEKKPTEPVKKIKRKRLVIRNKPRIRAITPKIERAHQKAVHSYFERIPIPQSQSGNAQMTPMYVEQVRSKLLRIWHFFKPYYKTAGAFERMLEIYGPVAIYQQLEFHRLIAENLKREEEARQYQQDNAYRQEYLKQMHLTGQIPIQQHFPLQQQQQQLQQQLPQQLQQPMPTHLQAHPSWRFQNQPNANFVHPNMIPNIQMTPQRMQQPHPVNPLTAMNNMNMSIGYDPQGHFTQTQDFFADSSSSSAVSTPTSGPGNSPFTPSRSRRGRGGKRANMGDRTPSADVGFTPSPLADMQKFSVAKRGRPRKNVPIAASPMVPGGNFPPPSPLSRPPGMISQSGPPTLQPYPPMPMNYPGNQPMASSAYGMHNQQQFNQPYPPQRLPYPQPPQPSHQMYSMQMQQMNQNFLSPAMQQPQNPQNYSYSSYEPSSSDDEETDPPPPKMPPVIKPVEQNVQMKKELPPVPQFQAPLPPELPIVSKAQKIEPPIQLPEKPMVAHLPIQKTETLAPAAAVEQKPKEKPKPSLGKTHITESTPVPTEKSHDKNKGSKRSKEKSARIIIDSDDSDQSPKPKKRKSTVDEGSKVSKESSHEKSKSSSKTKSPEPRISSSSERKKEKREKNEKDKELALAQLKEERAKKERKKERQAKLEQLEQKQAEKAASAVAMTEEERLKKEKRERKEKRRLERERLEREEEERIRLKKEKKLLKLKKEEASLKDKTSSANVSSSSVVPTKEKVRKRRRIESDDDDYVPPEPGSSHKTPTKASKSSASEKREYTSLKKHDSMKSKDPSSKKMATEEAMHKRFEDIDIPVFDFSWPPGMKNKPVFADIILEPAITVKIQIDLVLKLYEAHMLLCNPNFSLPKSTSIQELKQRCIDNAKIVHPGLEAILDDKKRLFTLLTVAQEKHKKDIQNIKNMEKMKLEHQKIKDEMAKKKEMAQKSKSKSTKTKTNPNTGKSLLDMDKSSNKFMDKKPKSKNSIARAQADAEIMAAAIQKATGSTIGMEALKSFKIPKVQEPPPPPPVEEKPKEPEPVPEKEKEREADNKDADSFKDDDYDRPDREYGSVAIYDRDSPRDRDRDKKNDGYNRRYSNDYDRRYDNERNYDRNDRNRNDRYDDYHRDDYGRQNYHYQDRRGGGNNAPGGGFIRRHRSPRGDDRRQNSYPSFRGRGGGGNFRGGRGNSNPGYRDDRSRDWKPNPRNTHDDFYEGLPPKQQQLNREAGAGIQEEYQSGDFQPNDRYQPRHNLPHDGSFPPPQRKVLLPNRMAGEPRAPYDPNRPGGWSGQGGYYHPPPPSGLPPPHKPPLLPTPVPGGSGDRRTSYESKTNPVPARPREIRDSPPDAGGLQIDDKSD